MLILFRIKSNKIQTIQKPTVFAGTNSLLKKFINKLGHRLANLHQLKYATYDSIMVIVDRLTKMVHYKPIKVTINAPNLAKIFKIELV